MAGEGGIARVQGTDENSHRGSPSPLPLGLAAADHLGWAQAGLPVVEPLLPVPEPPPTAVPEDRWSSMRLRRLLVGLDVVALLTAWSVTLLARALWQPATAGQLLAVGGTALALTVLGVAAISSQRLYQARVCAIKVVEHTRLARAAAAAGVGAWLAGAMTALPVTPLTAATAATGAISSFVLLAVLRGGYRAWLRALRSSGRLARDVVLVGTGAEGARLYELLRQNPELGYRVAGIVGDRAAALVHGFEAPFLGGIERAVEAVRECGASGVVVSASCLPPDELNRAVRQLLAADVHVHLSTGLRGVAQRRLRSQAFAHEPMFYLEQASLEPGQLTIKRALDVTVAAVALVAALPVLAVAALAVKAHDRGPVIFRQQRVGRDGRLFTLYKLRTMVTDAEARLELLRAQNERHGPLFKLAEDPRVTRVGRLLRKLNLDELPQLVNVLQGTMSLVGPRPALPEEVEQFSDELQARTRLLPGITGLWQVEANDKPEFAAYERLDLFYVENWSVGLDLAILFATAEVILVRAVTGLGRPRPQPLRRSQMRLALARLVGNRL